MPRRAIFTNRVYKVEMPYHVPIWKIHLFRTSHFDF